jgi:phage/plasmid-associated DNA primase
MAHPFSDFEKYIGTPVEPFIIPIIPAKNADGTPTTLRPSSSLEPENLGKIPGLWYDDGWTGFGAWQNHRSTASNLRVWQGWQDKTGVAIPIGFITADVHAADIDSDKQEIVDAHVALLNKHLGTSMVVRCRNKSTRCVLFYKHEDHTAPIRKYRVAFIDKEGVKHAVEFLAGGQQVVAEGPHAKGEMHGWLHAIGLVEGYDELPVVNIEMINAWEQGARQWVRDQGFTLEKGSLPSRSDRAAAVSITNLMSPHRARDTDMLAKAIAKIDINDPKLASYDTWCALFRAMKAACGGEQAFYAEHILPWLLKNSENHEEDMQAKWDSFRDSQLGAEYVYAWAARFGFTEGIVAIAQELFEGIAGDTANTGGGEQTIDGDGGRSSPASALLAQPAGPIPPDDTHWLIANAFIAAYGARWRYNVDAKRWFTFDGLIWQPSETILETLGGMMSEQAAAILQRVNGPQGEARYRALTSMGNIASVRNLLQGRSEMVVSEEDFDAHPHLLNTPDGVIDLRAGAMSDPDPTLLMRQLTLCGPDWNLATYFNGGQDVYEQRCPRFFSVLRNIANDRVWVKDAIRVWYGYCLTGEIRHHGLFFVQGPPGIGKSQVLYVLFHLLRTYAKKLTDAFLSKNGGESKRFDMASVIGKRMLFKDETMLGMSWDEARVSDMASGEVLVAELKFGREVEFRNNGKICVVGNHRPHFIAGEAGGLTDRMLLLEAQGKKIRHTDEDIENYAAEIVDKEGPAILMWALEACIADYGPDGRQIYRKVMAPLAAAALGYTRENSLYRQWIDSGRMRAHPDADVDMIEAFEHFLEFAKSRNERSNLRLADFKQGVKAAFPELEFAKRTTRPHPNRSYIKGLGFPEVEFPVDGNVVRFQ